MKSTKQIVQNLLDYITGSSIDTVVLPSMFEMIIEQTIEEAKREQWGPFTCLDCKEEYTPYLCTSCRRNREIACPACSHEFYG